MIIKNAEFITSVGAKAQMLKNTVPEIAIAGRSNVGKSSFINFITGYGKLAKTSKDPGRTRLINYFGCNKGEFILVDLPGYGFARVSDNEKLKWGELIEAYFQKSPSLRNVFLLLDIRRDINDDDIMMVNYFYHYNISFTVIATKADKLSRSACLARKREIAKQLKIGVDNVLVTSSLKKTGKEDVLTRIDNIVNAEIIVEEDDEEE
ncbi:MAG: YihA family ribosome biogenesis GTP-binding protein [Clostridia bacterium]|nr:YihA family ribosome biogenesis GTP-binding protein [Clostridia bacterium]